jgi:YbbR domain-containing protein
MKNSKLNLQSIGFLFTVMFFLSVNIMAQQKKDTQNKTVTPKTATPKKIVGASNY